MTAKSRPRRGNSSIETWQIATPSPGTPGANRAAFGAALNNGGPTFFSRASIPSSPAANGVNCPISDRGGPDRPNPKHQHPIAPHVSRFTFPLFQRNPVVVKGQSVFQMAGWQCQAIQ